ncbi:MAG: ankyrin repeat domain-containing protein, partial [Pseudomonadota bacterium]
MARWRAAIASDDLATLTRLVDTQNPAVADAQGRTALMVAAKHADLELMRSLLRRRASVDQLSATGGSALMFAVLSGALAPVELLLSNRARVTLPSRNGWTALILAAAKNELAMVERLLASGADVQHADVYGFNAVMRAVENRHVPVVQRLLQVGSGQLGQRDSLGNTALHYAASVADDTLVRLLLEAGAPVRPNNRGMLPVDALPPTAPAALRARLA